LFSVTESWVPLEPPVETFVAEPDDGSLAEAG
jgi:hypothetical protein